jgi:predicted nuclease of predicted toxin-antitoxin system
MPQATDADILQRAVSDDRIVVTNDKDFGELVYRSGQEHRGVVLLRLRDERAANKARVMKAVLETVGDRLRDNYVVATETGIRVRKARIE